MEKVVIIGSGPAGLTASIYCARASLSPFVLTGMEPGGQLTTTSVIENWPGFVDGIDGNRLVGDMRQQSERFGSRFAMLQVEKLSKKEDGTFLLECEDGVKFESQTVIIATGASAITLPLPNKDKLMGYGLSTCAICDGFFYRNKIVAVVGGGDSAMEEAVQLAKTSSKVFLIHRNEAFRASKIMQNRALNNPKIEIILNNQVVDTLSDETGLTGIILEDVQKKRRNIELQGLFMAIGHKPNTSFVKDFIKLDDKGYILTHSGTHTNVSGIFAAGDVEDRLYRQAITAAGRGCQAALQLETYLSGLS